MVMNLRRIKKNYWLILSVFCSVTFLYSAAGALKSPKKLLGYNPQADAIAPAEKGCTSALLCTHGFGDKKNKFGLSIPKALHTFFSL